MFVAGTRIKLAGGWIFAGTLEHTEAGNILRSVPGETIPSNYRTVDPACDHCQLKRNRKDTYIVRSEAGKFTQVGRTCLKDFVGHRSPAAIAAWSQYIAELSGYIEDELITGSGRPTGLDAIYFLTLVAASIRLYGWTPRSRSDDYSAATADNALWWADEDSKTMAEDNAILDRNGIQLTTRTGKPVETSPADRDLAQAALIWARTLSGDQIVENDYLWNLHIAAQSDGFTWRQAGLAASMISAYTRHLQAIAKQTRGNGKVSDFVGTVKTRQDFSGLELVGVFSFEGTYGVTHIHKFYDQAGNIIVWKTGSVLLDQGSIYSGKATVKAHDTYRGDKQTVVTRASLVEQE